MKRETSPQVMNKTGRINMYYFLFQVRMLHLDLMLIWDANDRMLLAAESEQLLSLHNRPFSANIHIKLSW